MQIFPLFLSFLKKVLPKPSIIMDKTLGYSNQINHLKKLLKHKEWELLENQLAKADSSELSLFIDYLAVTDEDNADLLSQWYTARPKRLYPLLVSSKHFMLWAWDARTGAYAKDVEDSAWELFFQRLDIAKEMLEEAMRIEPKHSEAYHQFITLGMAHNGVSKTEAIAKLNEVSKGHFSAQCNIVYSLVERWGGKEGEALDYAYNFCNDVPKGSAFHALIASVHVDRWVGLEYDERENYFSQRGVRDDIFNAYEYAFPDEVFSDDIDSILALNLFAFCFYQGKRKTIASKILVFLDGRTGESPWQYINTFMSLVDENYTYSSVYNECKIAL